jgi:hypothetical protein
MTYEERVAAIMEKRSVRYDQLAKQSKEDLIAMARRTRRVMSIDKTFSKRDAIATILDHELSVPRTPRTFGAR